MKRSSAIVVFVVLFGAAAIAQSRAVSPSKERLLGAWNLVSFTSFDANGASRPGAYDVGRIHYDAAGQMSAQLMHSSNKSDKTPATDEERSAAYRRYLGYYGPFTVDESSGTVTHHVIGSSNPSWVGSRQVRYFTLSDDGNRLTLAVKNNGRVTSTLVWERVR
jgi:opacity protein-like surface antigen